MCFGCWLDVEEVVEADVMDERRLALTETTPSALYMRVLTDVTLVRSMTFSREVHLDASCGEMSSRLPARPGRVLSIYKGFDSLCWKVSGHECAVGKLPRRRDTGLP